MINESFDPMDTPGKKRKRDTFSKFTSSTPIKLSNKENCLFSDTLCMEVKSIADLVAERQKKALPVNDYEVIRKPPKKKKKFSTDEHCFANPGLDLKVDSEKVINPFEVIRDDDTEAKLLAQGIANPALDVNYDTSAPQEPPQINTNPFEVVRDAEVSKLSGIDNVACEINNQPTQHALVLPLPFTPTVNHRIDFSKMPDNLTPSTLLSSKLVLENNEAKITVATPTRNATKVVSKSLSIISEEENELDIGEELDNYQLQLENSINEAKMQNRKYTLDAIEEEKCERGNATYTKEILKTIEESAKEIEELKESNVDSIFNDTNDDVQFEEVDSFEDIQKLGQFKRAYRTDATAAVTKAPGNQEENQHKEKKSSKIGTSIRRSIRKFIHPKSVSLSEGKLNEDNEKSSDEKHEGIFQTIRQSLRRKHKPKIMQVSLETSIVGRKVFREETSNDEGKTLERQTLKRNIVKTMKTFMESVEEFDHY
jgi:hypothetical protein